MPRVGLAGNAGSDIRCVPDCIQCAGKSCCLLDSRTDAAVYRHYAIGISADFRKEDAVSGGVDRAGIRDVPEREARYRNGFNIGIYRLSGFLYRRRESAGTNR